MEPCHYSAAVAGLRRDFAIEFATTPQQQLEAFRIRHQVYCVERRFEPGKDGLESDEYDALSSHVLLREQRTGEVVGTVRLVVPPLHGFAIDLPMERVTFLPRLRQIPRERLAEVSRFGLSKSQRAVGGTLGALLRLYLIRGIVQLSGEMGVTHWCALMEPSLLRLLQFSAIYFHQLSGMVEHHGLRQPSWVGLEEMLDRVQCEKPAVWDFITDGGTLWQPERLVNAA